MFTNPICHWSGGTVVPLFTWAPGDLTNEVIPAGQPAQRPNARVFYDSSAALVAAGVPAPTYLHPCQEAAGSGTIIDVTGAGADLVAGGEVRQGCRTPVLWDPVNLNFHGYARRAVEAMHALPVGFVCANPALGDPGTGDLAIFTVYRLYDYSGTREVLVQKKRGSGTDTGWALTISGGTAVLYGKASGGSTLRQASSLSVDSWCGILTAVFAYINRTANQARVWMSCGVASPGNHWAAAADWSAMGANPITSPNGLSIFSGGVTPDYNSSGSHVLYNAIWLGANATDTFTNWDAIYAPILWPRISPNGNDSPNFNLENYDGLNVTAWSSAIVGNDPLTGLTYADFGRGVYGMGEYPWRYDPGLTRTSKLTTVTQSSPDISLTVNNLVEWSDRVDQANWVKTSVTVSALWADMIENPSGFRQARRLTATAAGGYIQDLTAISAGTNYCIDFFYRRGSAMGADVAGRLIAYNVTGGAEIASVAFTAGALWGRTYLEFASPGAVSFGFRIQITNNAAVIHVARCSLYKGGFEDCPIQHGNDSPDYSSSTTHFKQMPSANLAMDAAQGEIEIKARRFSNVANPKVQYLCCINTGIGSGAGRINNQRRIWIDVSNRIVAEVKTSAGVVVCTMTSAAIDMTTERLIRLRWSTGGLPSGNTIELIIDAAAPISGSLVGWVNSQTADTYNFGCQYSTDTDEHFGGSINYVRVWAAPRP